VAVIEAVKKNLERVRGELPADVKIQIIRDQSDYIYAALHEIDLHLVIGSILASLVVLLFMRSWRATIIAGIAIPTSLVATFGVMWALDFTLNGVTMLALVLMIGIVIDDAIVVLENIFRFIEEKNLTPMQAAAGATAEIGLAVMATTFSLVVIFVPVSFMSSVSGRFLYQFGITAAAAVLVSLLVSFTLTPMMSARFLHISDAHKGHGGGSRGGFYAKIDRLYDWSLRLALRFRFAVAVIALLVVASAWPLYGMVKQEYVPSNVDEAEFQVSVTGPESVSIAAMEPVMRQIDAQLRAMPEVTLVQASLGGGFLGGVNSARYYVRIAPHEQRLFSLTRLLKETLHGHPWKAWQGNYSQRQVMSKIRNELKKYPDVRVVVRNYPSFNIGGGNWDVDFVFRGPELDKLAQYAEELRSRAIKIGGFTDLDSSLKLTKSELQVNIDRTRAADLGVDPDDIGTALQLMVGGDEQVTRYRDPAQAEDYDVRLRLTASYRSNPKLLNNLYLKTEDNQLVQLGDLAHITHTFTPSRIDRLNRQRSVDLRGGIAPGYAQADRIEALREQAREMHLPAGYVTSISGRSRELEKTFNQFLWAFLLSVILMYMILAAQFESLTHPLVILASLPLSIPFALLSLWGTGNTLNLYSALGVLVLFGVVKKNAILQVDHTNQLRQAGLNRFDAIIHGNRDRLRPILMTTCALVAGMLPLAVGTGPGSEERRTIAVVIIGGQLMALGLTLIVTPVVYALVDDVVEKITRWTGAPLSTPPSENPATVSQPPEIH
jgi:HAE1 family hydrophobic/amphiphilic exporter-1